MPGVQAGGLPGGRLHLQHGPIDLVIGAEGPGRDAAFDAARARFDGLLEDLVAELPLLRRPVCAERPAGPVARAMHAASHPFLPGFVTPMAAVAGAVADHVLRAMTETAELRTAYVNNGGDVALHIAPGATLTAAIANGRGDRATIPHASPVRGIATSGWRGRSHSLGIADAVTVLARRAAMADVAATLIANAVNLPGHPAILREPACLRAPDSDLGTRLVTVDVGALAPAEAARALDAGAAFAEATRARGLIEAALLVLQGQTRIIGPTGLTAPG